MKALIAQTRNEVLMTLRRAESLLLVLGIPLVLLAFFSQIDVLPTGGADTVDFLLPGVIGLSILSSGFTSLAISTGFERRYSVLKRLSITPLGRPRLIAAKIIATLFVEVIQVALLLLLGIALGWHRESSSAALIGAAAILLATIAFCGLGLLMAGTLRAEATLAAANAIYILLLLSSGLVFTLDKLPNIAAQISRLLPVAALADILREALAKSPDFTHLGSQPWIVLCVWAAVAPLAAARFFRWE